MSKDAISFKQVLSKVAKEKGFHLTKFADQICERKSKLNLNWYDCPCNPNDTTRLCISISCERDIKTRGHCHCNLFQLNESMDDFIEKENDNGSNY